MNGEEKRTQEAKSVISPSQLWQDLVMALTAHKPFTWLLLVTKIHISAVPAYWMSSDRAAGAKPAPNPVTGENNQQNKPNQFILWIKP